MVFREFTKIFVYFLLFLSLFSIAFANYPQFEFTQTQYASGEVDVVAQASSGTQLDLYVNDNFIARKDVISPAKTRLLNSSIQNEIVSFGANLVFQNNNASRVYKLNVSGDYSVLVYGDRYNFQSYELGDVLFRDEEENLAKKITVVDELATVTFDDVHDYMEDGENTFKFVLRSPLPTPTEEEEFEFSVAYEKYSNIIQITNYTNVTDQNSIKVSGFVSDASSPLYYVLNTDGPIANSGVLRPISLNGNNFNLTISSLREGENSIRFITTEPGNINLFNGERKIDVLVDSIPPEIEILNSFRLFTNEPRLRLNISTDAVLLNYTFDDRNHSEEVENGSVFLELSLEDGSNPLVLTAIDIAGNIRKQSHTIEFNDEDPDFVKDSLEPEELFENKIAHFFFQRISGQTTKPEVQMTIFTLPEDARAQDGSRISCKNFENMFYRNLGQLDDERPEGSELNLNESQISLLGLLHKKVEVTSDSDGSFDAIIALQESSFDEGDYDDARRDERNPEVGSVKSRNQICFILADKYGNKEVIEYQVTLDAGNTMWRPGEITTIPNTIYAAEIEQSGDVRSGRGNVEFGVIARFSYVGAGKVSNLDHFRVRMDTKGSTDSKYASIDSSRMNYKLDKNTGEMIVYFPVKVKKLDKKPIDYPDKLNFAFAAEVTYEVDDTDIPIDTVNPIYFQTQINIERPLDHTKWLTPETIDKLLNFLNKTTNITKTLATYTGHAAVAGVLTCTGAKFWYGVEVAAANALPDEDEKKKKLDDAKETLFMICDRVACTASPNQCVGEVDNNFEEGESGIVDVDGPGHVDRTALDNAQVISQKDEGRVLARFESLSVGKSCDYDGDGNDDDGVLISGDVSKYSDEAGPDLWYLVGERGKQYISNRCVPAKYVDEVDSSGNPTGKEKLAAVDLKGASGVCYNPGPPNFDNTRCNFFGLEEEGAAGWDPADNIIESVRCGCITDTYSHLKNYLKIMEGIQMCLEQAKIGNVKGSYCERLLSQAVCDIGTNVLFKTIGQQSVSNRVGTDGEDSHDSIFLNALRGAQEGDRILNDRYRGTFFSQTGMGTDQIVNKACVAAVTGDWSVLTENILSSLDQNEVEPVFGPAFPESRLQGYNPITGDLSIMYRFTYGVVSGGQHITTKVQFICDKSQPGGEYCPDQRVTSEEAGAGFNIRTLSVGEGDVRSDTIVATDTKARFRYNVLRLEHIYTVKGEQKTKIQEESVFQKGEFLFSNCYFTGGVLGAGSGFRCDTLFSNDALMSAYRINEKETHMSPMPANTNMAIYYPGNPVFVNLAYDIRTDDYTEQSSFDLAYVATCEGLGDAKAVKKGVKEVNINSDAVFGRAIEKLFEIPVIGEDTGAEEGVVYSTTIPGDELNQYDAFKISATNADPTRTVQFTISEATTGTGQNILVPVTDFVAQDFRINNGDAVQTKILDRSFTIAETSEDVRIQIKVLGATRGELALSLVDANNPDDVIQVFSARELGVEVTDTFDKLQEGTCEIKMKVLPSGEGALAVADINKFDEYSSLGNDDIETNVRVNPVYKTSFLVKNTNPEEDLKSSFEMVYPFEGSTVCIDEQNQNIEFKYLLTKSKDEEAIYKIDYILKPEGFVNVPGGASLQETEDSPNSFEVALENIESIREEDSAVPITMTFDVTVDGEENKVTTRSVDLKFFLNYRENGCGTWSIYGTSAGVQPGIENTQNPSGSEIGSALS